MGSDEIPREIAQAAARAWDQVGHEPHFRWTMAVPFDLDAPIDRDWLERLRTAVEQQLGDPVRYTVSIAQAFTEEPATYLFAIKILVEPTEPADARDWYELRLPRGASYKLQTV